MKAALLTLVLSLIFLCATAKRDHHRNRRGHKRKSASLPANCSRSDSHYEVEFTFYNSSANDCSQKSKMAGFYKYKTCECVAGSEESPFFQSSYVDVPATFTKNEGCTTGDVCFGVHRFFSATGSTSCKGFKYGDYAPQIFDDCEIDPTLKGYHFLLIKGTERGVGGSDANPGRLHD